MFCSTLVYATKGAPSECQQHWPEYDGRDLQSYTVKQIVTLPMCLCVSKGKVVPIKLRENLPPLVHLFLKQGRNANKELL